MLTNFIDKTTKFGYIGPYMTKPEDILQQFGLSPQEAELYIAALAAGPSPISHIAKKSNKTRTAVYFHIENLLRKGILKESRIKGKRVIVALSPQELSARFDRLTTDFRSLIPQLDALHRAEGARPVIRITDSKQGYFEILDAVSSLPIGKQFRVLEGTNALDGELALLTNEEWKRFFSRIIDRKIETKALFTSETFASPKKQLSKEAFELLHKRIWHVRSLPEAVVPFRDLVIMYGDTVAFMFPTSKLVMTVQHAGIAAAFAAIFDGLFNLGQPQRELWK